MQIHELPRGGQLTIHGSIFNVPSDVNSTVHYLSRLMNESQTIPIKIKRRLSYKHHYQFQNVRPEKVFDAVKYLVGTSDLFKYDIEQRCMIFIKYIEEKSCEIIDEYYEYIERLADELLNNKRLHIKDIAYVLGDDLKKKGLISI